MSQANIKIQRHYRIIEVQEMLGVSRTTVYRWAQEGRLRLVKYGKRAMGVPADSLAKMLGERE